MRAIVTGAGGQLGRELVRSAPPEVELHALSRRELDLADPRGVERTIAELAPDLVVNAAAYTAVDRAEAEPERAFEVNADGVGRLAAAATRRGARLLHVSTDFVFGGERPVPFAPEDEPAPRSVYGDSKRRGEVLALEATEGAALVVRTSWLYSRFGRNFVKTMLALMGDRPRVEVVEDQVGSPTWARGAAEALWRAAARPALRGVLHWSDAGVASWYDFAVAIQEEAAALGLLRRPVEVHPIRSEDFPTAARRPRYSVLDCRSSRAALGLEPRHWRHGLRAMLAELREAEGG